MLSGMLSGMRAVMLAVWLAGCTISGGSRRPAAPTEPPADIMPSAVLDRQDPGADTSRNPELSRSSSRSLLDGLLSGLSWNSSSSSPSMFGGSTEAPHYYQGCRGCSTEGPGGLSAVAIAAAVAAAAGFGRQRRSRRRAASPRVHGSGPPARAWR